ncbi:thioredoxin family protein [Streptomyces polyrhachis]|uniref:Thioredoxin family protein n=1 Tax=Streptomyces polyrhachis TaxID=1282885 RepID=A0ABW2GFX2_9ACTN
MAAGAAAVLLTFGASGCGEDGGPVVGGVDSKAPGVSAPAEASPDAAPEATAGDGYDPGRDAAADIATAQQAARGDGRSVLIDFGADWCADCQVLAKHFASPKVADLLAEKYHMVTVDVGEFDRNLDVAKKYVDLKTSGMPALVVLGPDGRIKVATNQGEFASARSMSADAVADFLIKWA